MAWHPTVDAFWRSPSGRIMKQNAAAGVTLGLHSQQEVDLLLDRADAAFRLEANRLLADKLAAPGTDEVLRQITALRLPSRPAHPVVSSFRSCRSGDPEPCETGFSELDTADLGKAVVATVIPGHRLKPIISDDDRKRTEPPRFCRRLVCLSYAAIDG